MEPDPQLDLASSVGREPEAVESPRALVDAGALAKVWRRMRWQKPHLYVVLRAYVEAIQLRDERNPRYGHGVFRGFYADLSRRLGVTENTVKYRLGAAIRWFARRCEPWKT